MSKQKDLLAMYNEDPLKRIDYVLVYENKSDEELSDPEDREKHQKLMDMRKRFEAGMTREGLQLQEDAIGTFVYVKVHVPIDRLCMEAEHIKLEVPLEGVSM